jgi:phytoene synthase
VAREHGRTFYFASRFLPSHSRRAIHAVYAYCRVADDIVDNAPATGPAAAEATLAAWEAELDDPRHPIAVTFAVVRDRYGVPVEAARDLVAGVRMDLFHQPYPTWVDLEGYCYKVAGTVGLMAAPLLGCADEGALGHAVDLGIAMQLTNILRDVAEDAELGRLYLPLDDLAAFGCDPDAIIAGRPNGRFPELMAFEIARARAYYASARLGVPALSAPGRFTALASARLYGGILSRIEDQNYDVFAARAHLSTRRKLRALPNVTADFFRLYLPLTARIGG